jgi:hypothetical protein
MLTRILRILIGFVVACLAAGLTLVLFVYTPGELLNGSPESAERMSQAGVLSLAVATHSAIFAAPFALIGAVFGEWRRIGGWSYYALVGVCIAVIGFLAQHASESAGQASILNNYALTAFLTAGLVAGVVYWLLSGRYAGGSEEPSVSAAGPSRA